MPTPPSSLSLHDALPISLALLSGPTERRAKAADGRILVVEEVLERHEREAVAGDRLDLAARERPGHGALRLRGLAPACDDEERSEEHTSELQSLTNLVCRPRRPLFPYTTLFRSPLLFSQGRRNVARKRRTGGSSSSRKSSNVMNVRPSPAIASTSPRVSGQGMAPSGSVGSRPRAMTRRDRKSTRLNSSH